MTGTSGIKWESSHGGKSYFGEFEPSNKLDYRAMEYWKDSIISLISDKRKLDRIAINILKKFYYCLGYKLGAKVVFVDRTGEGKYDYVTLMNIYNIPTREKVTEVYNYIKKKGGSKYVAYATASYDKKYKYILSVESKMLNIQLSTFKKTKVPHKEVDGVYKYENAVRKFGDFKKVFDTINNTKIWKTCSEVEKEYRKKYKIRIMTDTSDANLVYTIINIPPNKLEEYYYKIKEQVNSSFCEVNYINKSTIEVVIELSSVGP